MNDALLALAVLVVAAHTGWTRHVTMSELHTIRQLLERSGKVDQMSEQNPEVEVVPDPVDPAADPDAVPDEDDDDGEDTAPA